MTGLVALLPAAVWLVPGVAGTPAALTPAPLASLPPGHDKALARALANRPHHDYPDQPDPAFKATAAWEWRPTAGAPLWVSLACAPTGNCLVAVLRAEGDVTVLFSSPKEWYPLSDKAILSTDAATKDLIVSDLPKIAPKRAGFVLVGKGIVMDVSSDPSRWASGQGAAPSPKPTLDVAVPIVVAVVDAWREKQSEALVARATFPFVAWWAVRDRKRMCHSKPHRFTARNVEDLRRKASALFRHPFGREPVLGRLMDPQYAAWRAFEPYLSKEERKRERPRGDVAYVQVELFDLSRGVDSQIDLEILPNGKVQQMIYEDFAWAEESLAQCNGD